MEHDPTTKEELMARIDQDWSALQVLVGRLPEAAMATPAPGGWSPKDNLAHLAAWLEVLLSYHMDDRPLHLLAGVDAATLDAMDEDGINDLFWRRSRDRSLAQVMADLEDKHLQVLARLDAMTFENLMRPRYADDPERRPLLGWVAGNTYEHYQEHAAIIRPVAERSTLPGRLVWIGDTRLYVVEQGRGYPLLVLHGGPGLDHHSFGDYLDPLADQFRLIYVDQRSQGLSDVTPPETWSLSQMAADVVALARALDLERYAVLGHSYGAFVALQNAVDFPAAAAQTIVSSGLPSARFLEAVDRNLASFEPVELREAVTGSWAREKVAETPEAVAELLTAQLPFHFKDPLDSRIRDYEERTAAAVYSPHVLRHFANAEYGGIEVEERLGRVGHPVLVLAGRHDRVCSVEGAQVMAAGLPQGELVVFEDSGHMTFVEETQRYLDAVRGFLNRHR